MLIYDLLVMLSQGPLHGQQGNLLKISTPIPWIMYQRLDFFIPQPITMNRMDSTTEKFW